MVGGGGGNECRQPFLSCVWECLVSWKPCITRCPSAGRCEHTGSRHGQRTGLGNVPSSSKHVWKLTPMACLDSGIIMTGNWLHWFFSVSNIEGLHRAAFWVSKCCYCGQRHKMIFKVIQSFWKAHISTTKKVIVSKIKNKARVCKQQTYRSVLNGLSNVTDLWNSRVNPSPVNAGVSISFDVLWWLIT